jgi:capsule polysaccharide export protein KpsE/RkpR
MEQMTEEKRRKKKKKRRKKLAISDDELLFGFIFFRIALYFFLPLHILSYISHIIFFLPSFKGRYEGLTKLEEM